MNRTQRRAAMRADKRRNRMVQNGQMPQPHVQLKTNHGHTDTHVVIQFSQPINNIMLTPEQADEFAKQVLHSKQLLAEHQEKKREAANG